MGDRLRAVRAAWLLAAFGLCPGCSHSDAAPPATCSGVCTSRSLKTLALVAGQPGGAGWVDGPLADAHFADPWTLATDGQGHVYVADGDVIRTIDVAAGTVKTLAGTYRQGGCVDGPVAQATFNTPSGF